MGAPVGGGSRRGIHAINITPMVDIILVLLVIFMVTSSAINASEAIEVDKPKAATGSASSADAETLVISCDPEGRFFSGERELADAADIARYARSVAATSPQVQAVIRCDRQASVEQLVTVMDALRSGGVDKYAVATDPAPPIDQ